MPSVQFIVRGKVQGVWFRASTREQAGRLGLGGDARNMPDGSVQVVAVGDADAIDALEQWLQVGPPLSRVDAVERSEMSDPPASDEGFTIG